MTVSLRPVPLEVLDLLAVGDLAAAGRALGTPVPPGFADAQWVWQHFADLVRTSSPPLPAWRAQHLVIEHGRIVGHVRLHSPRPDGSCQAGWHVEPIDRGRGVAQAAASALVDLAETTDTTALVALVSPDNPASLAVAHAVGFVDAGDERHWTGPLMRRLVLTLPRTRAATVPADRAPLA